MFTILHFTEINGNKEYIVMTEQEITDELIDNHEIIGYELHSKHEVEGDTGVMPMDYALFPRI